MLKCRQDITCIITRRMRAPDAGEGPARTEDCRPCSNCRPVVCALAGILTTNRPRTAMCRSPGPSLFAHAFRYLSQRCDESSTSNSSAAAWRPSCGSVQRPTPRQSWDDALELGSSGASSTSPVDSFGSTKLKDPSIRSPTFLLRSSVSRHATAHRTKESRGRRPEQCNPMRCTPPAPWRTEDAGRSP